MTETVNLISGSLIVILNLIPFILKKPKLLLLTITISLLIAIILTFI